MRMCIVLLAFVGLHCLGILSGCCDFETITYEWTGIEVVNLDNSGAVPLEMGEGEIPAPAYGFRVDAVTQLLARNRIGGIPAAYGQSCPADFRFSSQDEIISIRVDMLTSDGGNIQAEDVTGDFVLFARPRYDENISAAYFTTVEQFLQNSYNLWVDGDERTTPDYRIDFFRVENAMPVRDVRFAVAFEMSDGRVISDTTAAVTLF